MERRDQLRNIAFGGDWSDLILVRERVTSALTALDAAVKDCCDQNPGTPEILAEVDYLCGRIARGEKIATSWRKWAINRDQFLRQSELSRLLNTIKSGIGLAAKS